MNVTEEIKTITAEIELRKHRIAWLEKNREKLEALPIGRFCGSQIDFDYLPHAEVVKVIRIVGSGVNRKWTKTPAENNTIHYEGDLDGMKIRCYQGQPPPSCKIIEVEEFVPAVTIPASVRKVKKMVCAPELAAAIASQIEKQDKATAAAPTLDPAPVA